MAPSGSPDTLMLPFLLRICYFAAVFAGMVQTACIFGNLGATSGQTGNVVRFGQAVAKSVYPWGGDDGTQQAEAYEFLYMLFSFLAGNFAGGVWTNHDSRKTLRTAGEGLIATGMLLLITSSMCLTEKGSADLKEKMRQMACFAMGLQNGILVATTGYANTVTTTGTLTDIGMLIGGAIAKSGRTPDKVLKVATLSVLVLCFVGGSSLGAMVFYLSRDFLGERLGVATSLLFPALGLISCGVVAKTHSHLTLSRVLAERESPLVEDAEPSPRLPAPAKSHPPVKKSAIEHPLVYGTYAACLCAGMIDVGAVMMIEDSPTPTHVTGPCVRLGIGGAAMIFAGSDEEKKFFLVNLYLSFSFFAGTVIAGTLTYRPEARTRARGSITLMIIAVLLTASIKLNWLLDREFSGELQHLCGFLMGLQNGVLCAVTGFARSTHMSGNIANVGICLGQAVNPHKANEALLFKLKANAILSIAFIIGVVLEACLIVAFPGRIRWVLIPAAMLFALAIIELIAERSDHQELLHKLAAEHKVSPQQVPKHALKRARLKHFAEIHWLAQAGGFCDSIAHAHHEHHGRHLGLRLHDHRLHHEHHDEHHSAVVEMSA